MLNQLLIFIHLASGNKGWYLYLSFSGGLVHQSEKTTQTYLDDFEDEVYDEVNKYLL